MAEVNSHGWTEVQQEFQGNLKRAFFYGAISQTQDSHPSHGQSINYRTINEPNQNRMCREVAVFLEHLFWDPDARHPRGFAVTSSPGDAHAQNSPELIIKLNPITQSAASLLGGISSVLWKPTRKAMNAITTQGYSS